MEYVKIEGDRAPFSVCSLLLGCPSLCLEGNGFSLLSWHGLGSVTLTKSEGFPVSPIFTTRGQQPDLCAFPCLVSWL